MWCLIENNLIIKLLIWSPGDRIFNRKTQVPCDAFFSWSWGAFIIPEIWFIWNEMWGANFLLVCSESLFINSAYKHVGLIGVSLYFLFVRFLSGVFGLTLLYFKKNLYNEPSMKI